MRMMVTGASSGIGEAIARKAAKRKFDLVLVARRRDRLQELKSELESEDGIEVEIIEADLTNPEDLKKVGERIEQGGIEILINNAGFGSSGPFLETDLENELNEIDLNVKALIYLTKKAVLEMVQKKRGTIVNMSSLASYMPMAGNSIYGGTKAFVTSFSHAIREELSETGVNIMVVCPGMTESEFHKRSKWSGSTATKEHPMLFWQTSEEVADAVYKGIDGQRGVVIPGLVNKTLAGVASSLPFSVTRKVTAFVAKGRRLR